MVGELPWRGSRGASHGETPDNGFGKVNCDMAKRVGKSNQA